MSLSKQYENASKLPKVRLQVTSVTEDSEIKKHLLDRGSKKWHMDILSQPFWEAKADILDEVIVLSPDAEEVLTDVPRKGVVVIGGLVDRTVAKSQTKNQAAQRTVRCFRLPIKESGLKPMNTVLTVTGVFDSLLGKFIYEDWKTAIEMALPRRKLMGSATRDRNRPKAQEQEANNKADTEDSEDEEDDSDDDSEGLDNDEDKGKDSEILENKISSDLKLRCSNPLM
eukprot:GHVP01038450.1.p2 GENE.GHVP01038450.1~~GHVP01038450.1.p2  ORF type:complete len:227 (+),score=53.44 GHVP01038450.1:631-1311(+)